MRKTFLLLLSLLVANSSFAGLIANTIKANVSDPTQVTTDAIDTTGSNLIVLVLSYYSPGGVSTISDSYSNTWTFITSQNGTFGSASAIFYCENPTVGSGHTFTATGGANYPTVAVAAWIRADSSSLDQVNQAPGGSSSVQPGSVTPSQDGALIVTGVTVNFGSSISIDSGFTLLNSWNAIAGTFATGTAYLVQGAQAAVNPTWSYTTSPSDNGSAVIATFKGDFREQNNDVFFGDGF